MAKPLGLVLSDGSTTYQLKPLDGMGPEINVISIERSGPAQIEWVPLHPFHGGLGPDKMQTPNAYTSTATTGIDSSNYGFITMPPKRNSLTMTSTAAQGASEARKMVEFTNGSAYVLDGRYVHSVSSAYSVATARDLGSGVVGTDILVVAGGIVVCCGASPIQTFDGSSWATSSDTYAHVMVISGDKLHRIRSTTGTIDNSYSAISLDGLTLANLRTDANWNAPDSSAGYIVGDNSYQVRWALDYDGAPWFFRADGAWKAGTQTIFKNQTPQMLQGPVASNGIGAFIGHGQMWVPYSRGLLRVSSGQSVGRGPEIAEVPLKGWLVRGGVEVNEALWLLVTNEQGTTQSVMKMVPDKLGASPNEYIFHEMVEHSATNQSRWIGLFSAPTNPSILFGGGTATTSANYFKLGRGAGRDIDDSNYQYENSGELVTGKISLGRGQAMETRLYSVVVKAFTGSGANGSVQVRYAKDDAFDATPTSQLFVDGETAATNSATLAGLQTVEFFPAPSTNTVGSMFNFRITLSQDSNETGQARTGVMEMWAKVALKPKMTDTLTWQFDMTGLSATGAGRTVKAETVFRKLKDWCDDGDLLTMQALGYEDERTIRVLIKDVREISIERPRVGTVAQVAPQRGISLTVQRMDYAGAYAT